MSRGTTRLRYFFKRISLKSRSIKPDAHFEAKAALNQGNRASCCLLSCLLGKLIFLHIWPLHHITTDFIRRRFCNIAKAKDKPWPKELNHTYHHTLLLIPWLCSTNTRCCNRKINYSVRLWCSLSYELNCFSKSSTSWSVSFLLKRNNLPMTTRFFIKNPIFYCFFLLN